MMRSQILPVLVLIPGLFAADFLNPVVTGPQRDGCEQIYQRAPLLIVQVTGSTLLGAYDSLLTVYTDGRATFSAIDPLTGQGSMRVAALNPAQILDLTQALRLAGAHELCDQKVIVLDLPLRTVSVFEGAQDAAVHTFSYWYEKEGYEGISAIIDAVMVDHFPAAH